jgi:long-chain-fatty-acid--CoA ligase ACSBG
MSGVHWVTEPHAVLTPKIEASGFAAIPAKTIIEVFRETVKKHGTRNAMASKPKVNGTVSAEWKYWTFAQYWEECVTFAKALVHLKVDSYKIINILGFNAPEWFIASNGAILAGCIGAGIYITNTSEACHYISEHSKAEVVVVEGNHQLKKYLKFNEATLPHLKAIVVYGEDVDSTLVSQCPFPVYSWSNFMAVGSAVPTEEVDNRSNGVQPGNCATLIYTSGTTGPPKAVMISHDNLCWTAENVLTNCLHLTHEERVVSYLPLSHVAGQLIDVYLTMFVGGCAYFAQPDALKGTLTSTMKEVRPTFFFGVPRVWEKIQEKMVQIGRANSALKQRIGAWAKSQGAARAQNAQFGKSGGAPCCYGLANSLVLSKVKEALGLDQTRVCFTAAAPISVETLTYFASLDIHIYEVFGQSECTGPHTFSHPAAWKIGSCGRPLKGTESKVDATNGELCYRGRHIFMGYMYMPDKTAETIDDEGYLHSGDVAEFDDDGDADITGPSGFMRITGRIKELIITAGGENIPPVLIENEMKSAMLAVSNCMVIGDKRKFLTMLVSLKVNLDADGLPGDELAADALFVGQQIGSSATTYSAAREDDAWQEYLNKGVKAANGKTTSNAQVVQKWAWLPADFSEKAGDLTPTLKLKRSVVSAKYADLADALYVGAE